MSVIDAEPATTIAADQIAGQVESAVASAVVLCSAEVLAGRPVVLVARDGDDHWHVLADPGVRATRDGGSAGHGAELVPVAWAQLLALDPSLGQLSGLCQGWQARRDDRTGVWQRSPA